MANWTKHILTMTVSAALHASNENTRSASMDLPSIPEDRHYICSDCRNDRICSKLDHNGLTRRFKQLSARKPGLQVTVANQSKALVLRDKCLECFGSDPVDYAIHFQDAFWGLAYALEENSS